MKHVQKLLMERTKNGHVKATVKTIDGETRTRSFSGLEMRDIVKGQISEDQLSDWTVKGGEPDAPSDPGTDAAAEA